MEEVFDKLIENAVLHGKADKISIFSEANRDRYLIFVKDNGKGIPEENLEKIFDFRYSKTGRYGLTFVKKIIEAHDGNISVDSKEGKGTTFIIRLPKPS